jgi:hypothetical protein
VIRPKELIGSVEQYRGKNTSRICHGLRLRGHHVIVFADGSVGMVSIDEELKAAKAAKAAIETLSTAALSGATIIILREAVRAATPMTILSSEGSLNEARHEVVIVLSDLIHGPPTQEKIDNAKDAIGVWMVELLQR